MFLLSLPSWMESAAVLEFSAGGVSFKRRRHSFSNLIHLSVVNAQETRAEK
jgi:hypothetical protein